MNRDSRGTDLPSGKSDPINLFSNNEHKRSMNETNSGRAHGLPRKSCHKDSKKANIPARNPEAMDLGRNNKRIWKINDRGLLNTNELSSKSDNSDLEETNKTTGKSEHRDLKSTNKSPKSFENKVSTKKNKPSRKSDNKNESIGLSQNTNFSWREKTPSINERKSLGRMNESSSKFGIRNLGNTCYLNSLFQALYPLKGLQTLMIQIKDRFDEEGK